MRFDLRQKSFACSHELPALGCQPSENAYLFTWQVAPGIGPERHEARDELRVDPVSLRPCATAYREGFDLGWRQLSCRDCCGIKSRPQAPFLPTSRLKAYKRIEFSRQICKLRVALLSVGQALSLPTWQTMNVQPIAAYIYADDRRVC